MKSSPRDVGTFLTTLNDIFSDEDFDIKSYFPNNLVKTSTKVGLQKKDAEKCIAILSK